MENISFFIVYFPYQYLYKASASLASINQSSKTARTGLTCRTGSALPVPGKSNDSPLAHLYGQLPRNWQLAEPACLQCQYIEDEVTACHSPVTS
jgi:hypothetical protein